MSKQYFQLIAMNKKDSSDQDDMRIILGWIILSILFSLLMYWAGNPPAIPSPHFYFALHFPRQ